MRRQQVIRFLEWTLAFVIVSTIIGYAGFAAKRVFEGPGIMLSSPIEGETINSSLISVRGGTRNAASLTLNGRLIGVNTEGEFEEQLLLAYGYNIIELVATDRAGKSVRKTVALFYK